MMQFLHAIIEYFNMYTLEQTQLELQTNKVSTLEESGLSFTNGEVFTFPNLTLTESLSFFTVY